MATLAPAARLSGKRRGIIGFVVSLACSLGLFAALLAATIALV